MTPFRFAPGALAAVVLAFTAGGTAAQGPAEPPRKSVFAAHEMVSAAEPLAVEAGLRVLHAGGGAADAAVAVQAVLGLVEPQSSGLGGGAFMLYYDARARKVIAYDGRETAPAGATADMFEGPDGRPMSFPAAVLSGRSTGAPGAVAMLALAQKGHGRLPWRSLFSDAERLADAGFAVTPRLAADINSGFFPQPKTPDATRYFTKPDGSRYQAGDILKNPAYAATLRRIAAEGAAGLLTGPVAADIAAEAHQPPTPGTLTVDDLARYRALEREPLCGEYRAYRVCTPPPPAGGVGLIELLGILKATDIAARGPRDPEAWFEFAQASRLAYADRDHYVGDPAFVPVPTAGLVDPAYDGARAALIPTIGGRTPPPGQPPGARPVGRDATVEPGGTSDFAIVDRFGDVVSMTTTVESVFGSGRMADGFFLNNQLTDFSFSPSNPDGSKAANAVAPDKRPRSSMTPVIVLDRRGRFVAAVGSPGGNAIIAYVAKALVGFIDWKLPIQQALALPNVVGRGDQVAIETGADPAIAALLKAHGITVRTNVGENSGLHAIVAVGGGYLGGADPRREGVARGD